MNNTVLMDVSKTWNFSNSENSESDCFRVRVVKIYQFLKKEVQTSKEVESITKSSRSPEISKCLESEETRHQIYQVFTSQVRFCGQQFVITTEKKFSNFEPRSLLLFIH